MMITAGRTLHRTCEVSGLHRRWKFRPHHHSGQAETAFTRSRTSIIWTSWTTEKTTTTTCSNTPAIENNSEEWSLWESWQVNLQRIWDYIPRMSILDTFLPTTPMVTTFRASLAWSFHTDLEMSSCRSGEELHLRPGALLKCTCRTCRLLPWIIVRRLDVTRPPLHGQVDPIARTWMFFFSSNNINQVLRTNRWVRLNLWVFWIQLLRGKNLTQI